MVVEVICMRSCSAPSCYHRLLQIYIMIFPIQLSYTSCFVIQIFFDRTLTIHAPQWPYSYSTSTMDETFGAILWFMMLISANGAILAISSIFVTRPGKTGHIGTFSVTRKIDLKYWNCRGSVLLAYGHTRFNCITRVVI